MMAKPDADVIVIGAGHNGLAAAAVLAGRGLRALCLEKNSYVGGMAGTREILSGCRNDVGASLLFRLAKRLAEELELERYRTSRDVILGIRSSNDGNDDALVESRRQISAAQLEKLGYSTREIRTRCWKTSGSPISVVTEWIRSRFAILIS